MSVLPFRRRPDPDLTPVREPDHADDGALMARVAGGDTGAFELLVRRHWAPVSAYAGRILNDRDAGKDIAQRTFVRIWQRRTEWREGSVRGYLLLVSRNLCVDDVRRATVRTRLADRVRGTIAGTIPTPADRFEASEIEAAIDRAVQELPPRRREAFILVHLRGLSYQEAADVMGVARATLSNQVVAALQQLRSRLKGVLGNR
jgi:RNA polymerase sigma-70 factor (ECF subfamily)